MPLLSSGALRRRWLRAGVAAALAGGIPTTVRSAASLRAGHADVSVHLRAQMRFWLYLPTGHGTGSEVWPAVFFLHGSGERGSDLQRVKAHGLPKLIAQGKSFPFVVVSPQVDEGGAWDPHWLHGLLELLKVRLRIDADRVCATGLSMGGHGAWDWACTYPADLAGIAPVCGYGNPLRACQMRDVPVRAYHGADDDVVPVAAQQKMVDAVRACGGSAEMVVYPGIGHDAWNPAYEDPQLYRWLLAQRRARP
jgi:predicted peptidase